MTLADLPTTFIRRSVGFDRFFNDIEHRLAGTMDQAFPPYNIAKTADNVHVITLAIAGFSMDDLNITQERNRLVIEGSVTAKEEIDYVYKGIANRSFKREFVIADYVHVESAKLKDGMLTIVLAREIPEEMQPKKIAIESNS